MPRNFKDHFSSRSENYDRYRPQYPAELFSWLVSFVPEYGRAWDCATGTGQAAKALADHFKEVIATDASEQQIHNAEARDNISYRVAPAEDSGIETGSIDLVTVALALHWFDIPAFFNEATRVLKPGGVLAVWSYNLLTVTPEVDKVILHLYHDLLEDYWPPERKLVEQDYSGIDFPFEGIAQPQLAMETQWQLENLLGYLGTWSAVKRYTKGIGKDPIALCHDDFASAWGDPEAERQVSWPLTVHAGVLNPKTG